MKQSNLILCACGCGNSINDRDKYGRKHYFIHGHQLRGHNNPAWKGGKYKEEERGYIFVKKPDHPFAFNRGGRGGYIKEHRLVWEEHNKAVLLPWGHIHHINEVKTDNRIENLEVMCNSEHVKLHLRKRYDKKKDR